MKTTMEVDGSTRDNLKEAGKKSQTYDKLINQRITCNARGCDRIGSVEIRLKAGKFGSVRLFVCPYCLHKFQD